MATRLISALAPLKESTATFHTKLDCRGFQHLNAESRSKFFSVGATRRAWLLAKAPRAVSAGRRSGGTGFRFSRRLQRMPSLS